MLAVSLARASLPIIAVLAALVACSPSPPDETLPSHQATTKAPEATTAPVFVGPSITDGIWTVGSEIPAGTYQATTTEAAGCYWWLIETGNIEGHRGGGTINRGDKPRVTLQEGIDFQMWNCGTWQRIA